MELYKRWRSVFRNQWFRKYGLTSGYQNEEALNCGFENKIRIYKGQDENGNNKSGITSFEFTRTIIEYYDAGNKTWDIEQILERKNIWCLK